MRKIELYGPIQEELGVIMAFAKIHEQLGFNKLVPSSARGFDINSIEYNGHDVTVEFEYKSSNFISHGHQNQMVGGRKYVIVCWEDDCGISTKLLSEYNKEVFEIIEMRKHVTIRKDLNHATAAEPQYVILSYNSANADRLDFGEWAFSNCYRTTTAPSNPKFAGDKLSPGSKILFYQNGYIVGGCTVVRYEVMDPPQSKREWELYKKLMDYPTTLFTMSIDEYKEFYSRGHIFYKDFFDIRDYKIRLSNFISKKMSRQGKMNIIREEYNNILGR